MSNDYWGHHFIFDVRNCDLNKVKDEQFIKDFSNKLVKAIDMVAMTEPFTKYCDTRDPEKAGVTLYQILQDSNIACHFLNDGRAFFDVFSCKRFDPEHVLAMFNEYFKPVGGDVEYVNYKMLDRVA